MAKSGQKLTIKDLIGAYMVEKTTRGYYPECTKKEFLDFIVYIEQYIEITESITEIDELLDGFSKKQEEYPSHIIMDKNGVLHATNNLNPNDSLDKYQYLMNYYDIKKVKNIIRDYLECFSEREIKTTGRINKKNKLLSECATSMIVSNIWDGYIWQNIECGYWPRQCNDIEKYFFDMDLAEKIELKTIKPDILDFYTHVSRNIAYLLNEHKDLHLSTSQNVYLEHANWNLVMKDESLLDTYCKEKEYSIYFDEDSFLVQCPNKNYQKSDYFDFGKERTPVITKETKKIVNENSKRLVLLLNKETKRR